MKLLALILVLLVSVAGCSRQSEPTASSEHEMEHRLAGVWVHKRTLKSGVDIVATLEISPDGTFTGIDTFSKPLPDGISRAENRGRWHLEDGFLNMMVTSSGLTNAQLPEEVRVRIVRLDDRELEYEPPERFGFYVPPNTVLPTNHIVFRKQTR